MKKINLSWFNLVIVVFLGWSSLFCVSDVWAVDTSTIESIDKYYTVFVNYVDKKTNNIWFKKMKSTIEERLRNTLLFWIEKKMDTLDWEQKIVFQTLWSKINQRKYSVQYTTHDLATQRELIGLINDFRSKQWLSALSYNALLSKAAYTHANDMYLNFPYDTNWDGVTENLSHVGTNGSRVDSRVSVLWYNYIVIAENIWYNQQTSTEVLSARKDSPTHYANLILEKATHIGVAKLWSYWVMVVWAERRNR
jgi:uncharacterized protein YkwD